MNFFAYFFSHKIVLAMYGAKEVTEAEAPELYKIVRRLAQRAGLPMPKVYIIQSEQPNAFATGRSPKHGVVAVTTGIMRILSREELEGVIGHELAHIKHRDILISTIAATIAGAISYLAQMAMWASIFGRSDDEDSGHPIVSLLMMIIAPIIAMIIQLAISRAREYSADEGGAKIAGNPLYLANALRKLHYASQAIPMEANPGTAHLFIVNPLSGRSLIKLLSTHPPIEERIERLEAMAKGYYKI
jgi:heat shock protein HtpX